MLEHLQQNQKMHGRDPGNFFYHKKTI